MFLNIQGLSQIGKGGFESLAIIVATFAHKLSAIV
jgi:hypothetical protein